MRVLWISQCPGCSSEVVVTRKHAGECEGERMCAPCNRAALTARRATKNIDAPCKPCYLAGAMTNQDRLASASSRLARRVRESLHGGLGPQDSRDMISDARLVAALTNSTVDSVLDAAIAQVRQ